MFADKSMDLEEQYDRIYRYCYFKVGKRETAEDITQEAFLKFFERFGHYGSPWTLQYLYRAAHNLCIDEYRKSALRQKREEPLEHGTEVFDADYTPAEDEVLTRIVVKDAMSVLSEEEKELLLLRYVNEVPIAVICQLFPMSRFAIYRKIKKALQKLQEQLERGGD